MNDNHDSNHLQKKGKGIINYILGILMILIYLGMGCLLGFTAFFNNSIFAKYKYLIAIIFLLYGLFRAYRLFKTNDNTQDDEN